jgi:hypothetical protein
MCKFQEFFGVECFPHGDTLNATFSNLAVEEREMVVSSMTETLIRKKVLYRYRLLGIYFIVAIDGTGTISFNHCHCHHCLTHTSNGKTLYYHPVLEAKIITSNGFAFSMMTEFIENPAGKATKQDCELKVEIPIQIGHPFRLKSATDSEANRPVIPTQIGHPG